MVHQRNGIVKGSLSFIESEKISELRLHHSVARKVAIVSISFDQGKGQKGLYRL